MDSFELIVQFYGAQWQELPEDSFSWEELLQAYHRPVLRRGYHDEPDWPVYQGEP